MRYLLKIYNFISLYLRLIIIIITQWLKWFNSTHEFMHLSHSARNRRFTTLHLLCNYIFIQDRTPYIITQIRIVLNIFTYIQAYYYLWISKYQRVIGYELKLFWLWTTITIPLLYMYYMGTFPTFMWCLYLLYPNFTGMSWYFLQSIRQFFYRVVLLW